MFYFKKYATINANTKKQVANTMVARCRTKSIPRAFCFPNKCSAPPEMAPDKPALFPFCRSTTVIKPIALITSSIVKKTSTVPPPNGYIKRLFEKRNI